MVGGSEVGDWVRLVECTSGCILFGLDLENGFVSHFGFRRRMHVLCGALVHAVRVGFDGGAVGAGAIGAGGFKFAE